MSPPDHTQLDESAAEEAGEFRPVGTVWLLAIYATVMVTLWLSMYLTMLSRGGNG